MVVKPIIQKGIQILKTANLGQIGKFTISAPKGAVSYDVISLVKNGNKINQYVFRDSSGKLLKSLRFTTDNKTMQTTAQARFYDYLDNPFVKKIKGVKEYKFNPNNECLGDTVCLTDITINDGECFEEIDFPIELMKQATEGSIFKYINGEYQ